MTPSALPPDFLILLSLWRAGVSVWLWNGRPGDRGSIPGRGKRIFAVASVSRPALGPLSLLYNGYRMSFPGGKTRPGRDADHSLYLVPMTWMSRSYTSSPPCVSIGELWDCCTYYTFEAEARLKNTLEFSPYLKENTTLHHCKDQLVNAVQGNIRWLHWEPYKTHKYRIESYLFLR
jgi:hypothetical protein